MVYEAATRGIDLCGGCGGEATLRIVEPLDGRDRERLERICRYRGRPPIVQVRLGDGRLRFTMKKPWRDGTTAVVFEPLDLVAHASRALATSPTPPVA